MTTGLKTRRVRFCTRISVPLRTRLTRYCAASGLSERAVAEGALSQYLDASSDKDLVLRRLDRVDAALEHGRYGLDLLSEAFGRFLRLWLAARGAHAPAPADLGLAERHFAAFARDLAEHFHRGHRLIDDLPPPERRRPERGV